MKMKMKFKDSQLAAEVFVKIEFKKLRYIVSS